MAMRRWRLRVSAAGHSFRAMSGILDPVDRARLPWRFFGRVAVRRGAG